MKNFNKLGLFKSKGRLYSEPQNRFRTPFQRDRDRIIHSASFRRLKHKTQVFVNTEGDHYRTRITHSIEVAQIARTIARFLNLNEELAETLSLAHDLGHTPFGHAAEEALNESMYDRGGFDHNLQTLRIVMFIENKYLKFKGLNLTIETLDGLLKHNGPIFDKKKISFNISPNPFNSSFTVTTSKNLEDKISEMVFYNIKGNEVLRNKVNLNGKTHIDFSKANLSSSFSTIIFLGVTSSPLANSKASFALSGRISKNSLF